MKNIKRILCAGVLFLLVYPCSAQKEKNPARAKKQNTQDSVFTLLGYGFMDSELLNARNVVGEKWGINYDVVGGCIVKKEMRQAVKANNDSVHIRIVAKYGENWKEKFHKEIDEELEKEKQVSAILDQVDFIKKKDDQMGLEGNGIHYYMKPIDGSAAYNVSVEGWGEINGNSAWVSYYRMKVNYRTKKYKLISDEILSVH